MFRPRYLLSILLIGIVFMFVAPSGVSAAIIDITGKGKVLSSGGYLDFNPSPYGSNVKTDNTTGDFSGFAWLEDIGWIAFGTDNNDQGPVKVNLATGVITGKAKALNTGAFLDFTNYSSNVVVGLITGVFSGYVWSEDVGWIDFADSGVFSAFSIGVTVEYYVDAYMTFDIDTGTGSGLAPGINCDSNTCLTHSGGGAGSNYTVSFGELKNAYINKSNGIEVSHSDGLDGQINSIYFDLTTNAEAGAVVSVSSANAGLKGPGTSVIKSISVDGGDDGDDVYLDSGRYGYTVYESPTAVYGTVVPNVLCMSAGHYCGAILSSKVVFDTNDSQIEGARVRLDLAAAANYTNTPGNYTDTLKFIATSTY